MPDSECANGECKLRPAIADVACAWDTFHILAATAIKLGVGFFLSLRDQMVASATTPTLAKRVAQREGIVAQPAV